ncbi:hypothetical protein ACFP81_07740 [Deinococcus lacus]|uniref:Swt1-like HEPN domain-containing protein n=1 Tax=Deinococcus lacus TaxID=392561 RepID=A0ABW1YC77_9DEIO
MIASSIIRAFEKDLREHLLACGKAQLDYQNCKTGKKYTLRLREGGQPIHGEADALGFIDLAEVCEQNADQIGIELDDIGYIAAFARDFKALRNDVAHSRNVTSEELTRMQQSITYIYNRSHKGGGGVRFSISGSLIKKGFVPSSEDLQAYATSAEAQAQQAALRRRNQVNLAQSNRVAATLLDYYAGGDKPRPGDTCYASYQTATGTRRLLTFASRECWNRVFIDSPPAQIRSGYIDPEMVPLPESGPTRHTPHRIKMGRYDLLDLGPYCLRSVETYADGLQLNFSEMPFFTWCDRYSDLEDEYVSQIPALLDEDKVPTNADLPLREQFLPHLESVFDSASRLTAGGVVVLTVIPIDEAASDALLLIEQRSTEVADGQGLLTTIPRGFHDRFASSHKDYDLEQTVMREVAEEVFNKSGLHKGEVDTEAYFDACPPVADLRRSGAYTLRPSSFGFDLLKGNYTVTYLLLVQDCTWWPRFRQYQGMNYEFSMSGGSKSVLLSDTLRLERLMGRPDWTTEGYVAFIEGLRQLPQTFEQAGLNALAYRAREVAELLPTLHWTSPDDAFWR